MFGCIVFAKMACYSFPLWSRPVGFWLASQLHFSDCHPKVICCCYYCGCWFLTKWRIFNSKWSPTGVRACAFDVYMTWPSSHMCPQNGEIKYRLLSPLWCTNPDTVAYNYYSSIVVSEPTVCFVSIVLKVGAGYLQVQLAQCNKSKPWVEVTSLS